MFSSKSDADLSSKTIRKIPQWVIDGFNRICANSERLPEAEMRFALAQHVRFHDDQAAVAVMQEKDAAVLRAREVGERLREMLTVFNLGLVSESLKLNNSRLAQAIGQQTVSDVAKWVAGQSEPKFDDLGAIAYQTGASFDWLAHGTGQMFSHTAKRIDEYAPNGAADIINSPRFKEVPAKIALLRNELSGDFSFVRLFDGGKWELNSPPYKISEKVGAGGESALNHLALIFAVLYKLWVRPGANNPVPSVIKSYNVDDEIYQRILSGIENVRYLIDKECTESPWWEDIWDTGGLNHNHFDGYSDLADRIQSRIASNKKLAEVMDLIRSENFEFMSSIKITTRWDPA